MNNRYALVLAALIILFFCDSNISNNKKSDESGMHIQTVNAVIGDKSYIAKFGKNPGKNISDRLRIRTHLEYVERLLRERPTDDLSPQQQINRAYNLDLLDQYIHAGNFPHNDGHPDPRRPVFIDEDENICAVGYLLEQTSGQKMVQAVNKRYKYAFIKEVNSPDFDRWAKKSGFTKRELAMIQPTYDQPPVRETETQNKDRLKTGYGILSAALLSANTIYLTNGAHNPWLFKSSKMNHVFGLAAGAGSVLLGALNLDNSTTKTIPVCGFVGPCWQNRFRQTNDLRTGVSIANIGVGLVSIARAAYYLIQPQKQKPEQRAAHLNVTHLQTGALPLRNSVPAMQFQYNF